MSSEKAATAATTEQTPELVTSSKIVEILKKIEKTENVEMVDFESGTTAVGEGWSSTLIRVDFKAKIDGAEKEYHWIGKFPPASPDRKVFHDASKMGEKEAMGYADFIPKLETFISESGLGADDIRLNFPRCPYADLESPDFPFYMENLKEAGFNEEVDKRLGLDEAHIRIVMRELAKFHAVGHSYVMQKAKESSIEQALKELEFHARDFVYTEPLDSMNQVLGSFAEAARKGIYSNVEALANDGEDFIGPLKRYECQDGVQVPKELCMVDIALYCWNSPVTDLSYFFFMSVHPDLREKRENEFLEYYHEQLAKYLEMFGIDLPSVYTLEQLKEEYNRKIPIGLMAALSSLPAVLLPKEHALDQSDFDWSDLDAMLEKAYQMFKIALADHPHIRERMRGNLLEALRKGILA